MTVISDTCASCGGNVRLDCVCPADAPSTCIVLPPHKHVASDPEYAYLTFEHVYAHVTDGPHGGPVIVAVHPLARLFPAPEGTAWIDHWEAQYAAVSDADAAAYDEYLNA